MPSANDIGAYQRARLEELAQRPNTTVFDVQHDVRNDPWPVSRLRPVLESVVARTLAFDDATDDFVVRKTCLDDPEVLAFQRQHPKLYWILTDRKIMREPKHRNAVHAMLQVRVEIESGRVQEGQDADALATKTVVRALQGQDTSPE